MSTKPKLKLIPLPKGFEKLPKGAVYLGEIPKQGRLFRGWNTSRNEGDWGEMDAYIGGNGHYAAPRDSAIAREILGEPSKTITRPAKTVTKAKKAKKPVTKPRVQRSKRIGVMPAAVKIQSGDIIEMNFEKFGVEFCQIAERDGIDLPDWLPALPPVPAGYDRWEPVGLNPDEEAILGLERYMYFHDPASMGSYHASVFVVKAVRDEKEESSLADQLASMLLPFDASPDNSAVGLLNEAAETIGARAAERDVESERSMARCVAAFNVMFGKDITEEQGWLFMVLLKMSRSTVGHRRDDYTDGASYFGLAGGCALNQTKS